MCGAPATEVAVRNEEIAPCFCLLSSLQVGRIQKVQGQVLARKMQRLKLCI